MSENSFHFAHDEAEEQMSADDLAVLQAFDAMETWQHTDALVSSTPQEQDDEFSDEDMLLLFAAEVDEDIGQMKRALSQLEQNDTLDLTRFTTLQRIAHKIRGTAGAMECYAMASLARHIEEVIAQIDNGSLFALVGLNVLVQAVLALEMTLQSLLADGQENDTHLVALEHQLEQFNGHGRPSDEGHGQPQGDGNGQTQNEEIELDGAVGTDLSRPLPLSTMNEDAINRSLQTDMAPPYPPLPPGIHVEAHRFGRLLRQAGELAEIHTPLENAQQQVDVALRELHAAQVRLQQLERALMDLALPQRQRLNVPPLPASSLVERMLKEATSRSGRIHGRVLKQRPHLLKTYEKFEWDELEFDRDSDRARTVYALRDAMVQVTVAHTHVQSAYDHLHTVTQRYVQHATELYTRVNLLRLTPLRVLLPQLQAVLATYAPDALFEVAGEMTEVDQDILDMLASPLVTLLHTCLLDTSTLQSPEHEVQRVWLHASAFGNEVTLEIGFSMTVQGGALDTLQSTLQKLGGTVALQRNSKDGVSFSLRFPRSQGTVHGMLVRVGDQHVVIPFSQMQRVSDEKHEKLDIVYHLYKLLNFPYEPDPHRRVTPLIVLPQGNSRLIAGILVDEVISDVNVIVKPLAEYLQRPGIAGTVLDGKGQVLLLLDIPALLKHYTRVRRNALPEVNEDMAKTRKTQRLALIADDSASLRRSLVHTLERAHYEITEARDGLEALNSLTQNPPDVFVLDMEMPNLSGYDLLGIMHVYPELNDVKIIILTSRASEKHKQRAMALGAHAYLTKPCPHDVLLATIEGLLQ